MFIIAGTDSSAADEQMPASRCESSQQALEQQCLPPNGPAWLQLEAGLVQGSPAAQQAQAAHESV